MKGDGVGRSGMGIVGVFCERPEGLIATADDFAIYGKGDSLFSSPHMERELEEFLRQNRNADLFREFGHVALMRHHNAYVNTGLNNSLDREFGLGGTAIGFIGVSSNNTAVTAATVFLNGASGGAAANTIIKAISPAASRSSQTVTGGATFVNGDFTSGVFIWNKIGFLTTSNDAGTGLVDVIGGAGGASPYNRTFSLDLTAAGTFSVVAQIAVTAVAV